MIDTISMNMSDYIRNLFEEDDFFYVTTDVKRALGLENVLPHFHIITTMYDPLIPFLRGKNIDVFCLSEIQKGYILPKSSGSLIAHPKVVEYVSQRSKNPSILSFKPSRAIDTVLSDNSFAHYRYLGNKRDLNERFEDKILFHSVVSENLEKNTIPSVIGELAGLKYREISGVLGKSVVIQFGKGWAGNTTFFAEDEKDFDELKIKFPETVVRVSKKINGTTFLNNCCIYRKKVFQSKPAIQISGIPWLNKNPSATSGREWGKGLLENSQENEIKMVTEKIGNILSESGYRGYFGLDFIIDNVSGHVYVSEINARFTASVPFYTKLELGKDIFPLYAYHLAEFLGKNIEKDYSYDMEIEGCEVNITSGREIKTGTYIVQDDADLFYKNDAYDPSSAQKEKEVVLISGEKKSLKIQTGYPVLESPGKFRERFEKVLKALF